MVSPKAPDRHPAFGTIYYWYLAVVFASATALGIMRWKEDYHLFLLGALAFGVASAGRAARRGLWGSGRAPWQMEFLAPPPTLAPFAEDAGGGPSRNRWFA
jgi:hypothetical protein